MEPLSFRRGKGPEFKVRERVIKMLERYGWIVKIVHGSMYQSGFPDLYCTHKKYGPRWIEVKLPNMEGSRWTAEQRKWFPILAENGTPIWVITNDTEYEYRKLFANDNWFEYMLMKS